MSNNAFKVLIGLMAAPAMAFAPKFDPIRLLGLAQTVSTG
jgi:hypothetical protein